jgi:PIN domain nuclease of toxin-antitoxin system
MALLMLPVHHIRMRSLPSLPFRQLFQDMASLMFIQKRKATQGTCSPILKLIPAFPPSLKIFLSVPMQLQQVFKLEWICIRSAQVAYSQVSGTPDLSGYQLTSNLSTVTTLGSSNTLYPSQLAVKTYVDNAVTAGGGYTDENAQDAIGTILSSEFTYSDATPSISINVIAASKITQDATHRFTTDAEKSTWNSKQDGDADLTTIAGLTATTNNFIVSVSSAWASRTPAQVKTTLSLDNVDNTSDATKTAQLQRLPIKGYLQGLELQHHLPRQHRTLMRMISTM